MLAVVGAEEERGPRTGGTPRRFFPRARLSREGREMEREEGAEAPRGRDKILCYINMQSPGNSGSPCGAPPPPPADMLLTCVSLTSSVKMELPAGRPQTFGLFQGARCFCVFGG